MKELMSMWVVYFNPKDFPGKYVVRRHAIAEVAGAFAPAVGSYATTEHYPCDSLEDARAHVPDELIRLPRRVEDDPVIVEVWL